MSAGFLHSFRINPADLPSEAVIFGRTSAMRDLHNKIDRILDNDLPVLIRGESGTGKEVIARYLHIRSNRSEGPFVKLNCAAIPFGLLEKDLLNRETSAYNEADETKRSVVEIADGGTLFLDEIGDMEWSLQTKLLDLLQDDDHCARIGGREERQARFRVICATNSDLEAAVGTHAFRQDLFYRIDVIGLHLSPLRERKEDIPQLYEYFMQKLAKKFGKGELQLAPDVLHMLKQCNWPGNLRELENWIARAIALGGEEELGAELSHQMTLVSSVDNLQPRNSDLKKASRNAASEAARAVILKVLQANHWNRRTTAEELNMSYRSLLYKLRDVGIPPRNKRKRDYRPDSDSLQH